MTIENRFAYGCVIALAALGMSAHLLYLRLRNRSRARTAIIALLTRGTVSRVTLWATLPNRGVNISNRMLDRILAELVKENLIGRERTRVLHNDEMDYQPETMYWLITHKEYSSESADYA